MSEGPASLRLADYLQSEEQNGHVFSEEEGRAVLGGFVVISEWIDEKGSRWLSQVHGDRDGKTLPEWRLQGYLHNALYHGSHFSDGADDEF